LVFKIPKKNEDDYSQLLHDLSKKKLYKGTVI